MADLKTNYKDDVLDTSKNEKRKFRMIQNDDGTVSFDDATEYTQQGDAFGAADINATNAKINEQSQSLININKFTSTNILAVNQDIVMNYDAFIMFRITYGNAAYTGYTLIVNDVVRDACAAISAVGEMTVTRSFEVKKGDKIRLDINTNTICHESKFYFK